MVISLNFALERLICSWTVKDGGEPDPFTTVYQNDESTPQAVLYYRIWLARKFTLFVSVIILCYKGMTFQDYNLINYQLLRDIQKQNDDLCRTVQILKNGGNDVVKSPNDVVDFNDEIVSKQTGFFCEIIFYTFRVLFVKSILCFFSIFLRKTKKWTMKPLMQVM